MNENSMAENAVIDSSAIIQGSKCESFVKIWRNVRIQNSIIEKEASIGDNSIIVGCQIGERSVIGRGNIISHTEIGRGTSTQGNTTIRYCTVGRYDAIAWNVTIGAPNHEMHCIALAETDYIFPTEERRSLPSFSEKKCRIGNDVWIAAGAHITRGVTISDGVIVAANAVVTKNVPPYAIVAGVPAKIIGYRFDKDIRDRLVSIKWWNLPQRVLDRARQCFDGDLTEEKLDKLESIINSQEEE